MLVTIIIIINIVCCTIVLFSLYVMCKYLRNLTLYIVWYTYVFLTNKVLNWIEYVVLRKLFLDDLEYILVTDSGELNMSSNEYEQQQSPV